VCIGSLSVNALWSDIGNLTPCEVGHEMHNLIALYCWQHSLASEPKWLAWLTARILLYACMHWLIDKLYQLHVLSCITTDASKQHQHTTTRQGTHQRWSSQRRYPLTPLLTYGYSCKASCVGPRVKSTFVIFDIRALSCWALSVRVPECQKLQMTT